MARRILSFTINALGATGYLSLALQWLWSISLYLPLVMSSDVVRQLDTAPHYTAPSISLPSSIELIFSAVITVGFIGLTIYLLIKLPAQALRSIDSTVTRSAKRLSPIIVRHTPTASLRARRQINRRLVYAIKILLCVVPFALAWFAPSPDPTIGHDLIAFIGSFLALTTLCAFGLQTLLTTRR